MASWQQRAARRQAVSAAARRAGGRSHPARRRRRAAHASRRRHANWEGIGSNRARRSEGAQPSRHHRRCRPRATAACCSSTRALPRRVEITALNLTTDEIAPDQPFTDTEDPGRTAHGRIRAGGRAVPSRGAEGRAEQGLFEPGRAASFELDFGGLEAEGGISGDLGRATRLAGTIRQQQLRRPRAARVVGVEAPKTTDPQALTRVAVRDLLASRRRRDRASIRWR